MLTMTSRRRQIRPIEDVTPISIEADLFFLILLFIAFFERRHFQPLQRAPEAGKDL